MTIPIFVSHFSDRARARHAAMVGQRLRSPRRHSDGGRPHEHPDHMAAVRRGRSWNRSRSRLPDYPFVGALALTLRDEQNERFAANYVNLVVKPDRPLPRIERRGPDDVAVRFEPGASPASNGRIRRRRPRARYTVTARDISSTGSRSPPRLSKAHPESIYYLFQAGSKAGRERVDWPQRVNRQDYPQTDMMRTWPSTLAVSLYGRLGRADRSA